MNKEAIEFLQTAISRVKYYKSLAEKTFEQVSDEDLNYQFNGESNSIAMIVQHMVGNMLSRWTNFLTEDGEKSWRQRDEEFVVHNYNKQQLIELWEKGWNCFLGTMNELTTEDLLKTIFIRKEPLTVIDAINRQLAHYAYHVGQIVFIGKMLKNEEWKSLSIPRKK